MTSPFFVDPLNDQGGNLAGLGNMVGEAAKRKTEMAKAQQSQQEVMDAFDSGDPRRMAEVSMKFPEVSENFNDGLQLGEERQKEAATGFQRTLMLMDPTDQQGIEQAFAQRVKDINDAGGNPENTIASYNAYVEDPEAFLAENEMVFAGRAPEEYKVFTESLEPGESKNVQRSVEIPGQGFTLVHEDGTLGWQPYDATTAAAYAASQEEAVKQARTVAEETTAAEGVVRARQAMEDSVNTGAFKARESLPRITRMAQLADIAQTGFGAETITKAKLLFGWDVADEEEFMALANAEILSAANNLSGALSERENEYLEAVGPGIGKSQEGNARIIRNLAVLANNAIERQGAWRAHRESDLPTSEFAFIGNDFEGTILPVDKSEMTTQELLDSLNN